MTAMGIHICENQMSVHPIVVNNPLLDTQLAAGAASDQVKLPINNFVEAKKDAPAPPNDVKPSAPVAESSCCSISCVVLVSVAVAIAAAFIVSVILAHQQAQGTATSAVSFDESPSMLETSQWNLFAVELPSFWDNTLEQQWFNTVPPNHYVPNLCSNTNCTFASGVVNAMANRASDNYIRLEMAYANLVPAVTGGSVTINWHVSMPQVLLDQSKLNPVSIFNIQIKIENTMINIAAGSSTFDGKFDFRLNDGTINLFPMDSYTKTFQIFCSIVDPNNALGNGSILYPVLNFWVKIDKSDLGAFSHTDKFLPFKTDEDGGYSPPKISTNFFRPQIGRIFPMFIIVAFWLIPLFEILFFASTYMGAKCSTPAPVSVAIGVLFALPGIRNTAGNGVPIGAVMDFGSFFWAELIAVLCFMYISYRYYIDTRPVPK
jgi:hypothetical protein